MYLINDTLSESLPVRFFLPSGSTRTSLHELSESELAELGIYYCDVVKPPKSWTQYYGYPVIEIANNRATATYPVLDYTQEDADRILEEAKEKKRNEIASARYEAECAGTEVNGMTIKTDRESQALITGAALQAIVDYDYECRWKTSDGFVHLSAEQIKYIAQLVRSHVQSCFDREAELCGLIDKAETPDELRRRRMNWGG